MSKQHKAPGKTWHRLALGSVLCASLNHCTDLDTPSETGETGTLEDGAFAPDTATTTAGASPVTGAATVIKVPHGADTRTVKRWFVELEGVPLVEGGDYQALDEGVDRFRKSAYDLGLPFREHSRFDGLIHGITVSVDARDLGKLSQVRGIKAVYPVGVSHLPHQERSLDPQLGSALAMTGADIVQNDLGFDGTGIRVGIIDTGIDVDHPDFHVGGTLAGASRIDLSRSYDFVGDDYDGSDPEKDTPAPDANPDDCAGHGTHVAGIVGASGNTATGGAKGVAPGVTFHAYRVFGCEGSVNDDVIAAAIERAYMDGAHIINLSLGSDNGWSHGFFAVALSRVLELGVVPVASAGNNGGNGVWTVGSPGVGEDVITVASVDNTKLEARWLKFSDDTVVPFAVLEGAADVPSTGTAGPVVYVGQGCPAADDGTLEDAYLADPQGKVALITRGGCFFSQKYERAKAAGATFVVVEQNRDEPPFPGFIGQNLEAPLPGIMISQADGTKLKALITANASTLAFQQGVVIIDNPTADRVSSFSSWGLTPELLLKPDIAAPGGAIRSTYPLSAEGSDGYATLDGTSMSSPHVAGAVALLLEAQPNLPRSRVRAILQNTAQPAFAYPGDETMLDGAHHQGAGKLRIDRAIVAKTVVTPSKLSTGEGEKGPFETQLYVENLSNTDTTYTFGTLDNALATWGDPFDSENGPHPYRLPAPAKVEFFTIGPSSQLVDATSVTVPAHTVRTIGIKITPPTEAPLGPDEFFPLPDGAVYSGFVTLTPDEASAATPVTVPYAGVVGDYQAIEAIAPPVFGLDTPIVLLKDASLTQKEDYRFSPDDVAEPYHVYSMKEDDTPTFMMRLAHGVSRLTAHLVPHGDLAWLSPVKTLDLTEFGRANGAGDGLTTWFGADEYGGGKLPDGEYHIRVTVLKALGDPKIPGHQVVLDTEPFRIDRSKEPPPAEEEEGG